MGKLWFFFLQIFDAVIKYILRTGSGVFLLLQSNNRLNYSSFETKFNFLNAVVSLKYKRPKFLSKLNRIWGIFEDPLLLMRILHGCKLISHKSPIL